MFQPHFLRGKYGMGAFAFVFFVVLILFLSPLSFQGSAPLLTEKMPVSFQQVHAQEEEGGGGPGGPNPGGPGDGPPAPEETETGTLTKFGLADATIGNFFELIGNFIFTIATWLLAVAGFLLEKSMAITIGTGGENIYALETVDTGWGIVRNVANIFFIFVLLYIAIATILQLGNFQTKQVLTRLIIIALLVNFSLFATRVVVDISNAIAIGFYTEIQEGFGYEAFNVAGESGTSSAFMDTMGLQTIAELENAEAIIIEGGSSEVSNFDIAKILFLGAIFAGIAAFIFLAAAIMLIIRTVVIMVLMIFAPLAFLAWVLPGTQGYFKQWWDMLFNQAFFAPILFFMIYISMLLAGSIEGLTGKEGAKFAGVGQLATDAGTVNIEDLNIIFHFAIVITLLILSLTAAKKMAAQTANVSVNWASKGVGAIGGFAGRQTLGRAAYRLQTGTGAIGQTGVGKKASETLRRWSNAPRYSPKRWIAATTGQAAQAGYDVRGANIPGVEGGAAGGAGGFEAAEKKRAETDAANAEQYFKSIQAEKDAEGEAIEGYGAGSKAKKQAEFIDKLPDRTFRGLSKNLSADDMAKLNRSGSKKFNDAEIRKMPVDQQEKIEKSIARIKRQEDINQLKAQLAEGDIETQAIKDSVAGMSADEFAEVFNTKFKTKSGEESMLGEKLAEQTDVLRDAITPQKFNKAIQKADLNEKQIASLAQNIKKLPDGNSLKNQINNAQGMTQLRLIKDKMREIPNEPPERTRVSKEVERTMPMQRSRGAFPQYDTQNVEKNISGEEVRGQTQRSDFVGEKAGGVPTTGGQARTEEDRQKTRQKSEATRQEESWERSRRGGSSESSGYESGTDTKPDDTE